MIRNILANRFADPVRTPLGRLQFGVFDISIGMPIHNATITVKEKATGRTIEQLMTNTSGQSITIDLPAPPVEYSQEPGQPKPYTEYNVEVSAPDFDTVQVNGIEVFPDVTALQDVRLLPLENVENEVRTITIPENTLWGSFPPKTPEDPVKPLEPESGFVVLDKPVIPEFIVVHAGIPTDKSAPNYYVPFADYIKNVASCEVYSTWPVSTITANVLAILSFTLNRVFTEWYRNKGYNFTITNSTAFDQAFSYGRNIYQEISAVVDNIFTSYITKPGIRQPLFTQYCDGIKTTCPNWLSQWGSKYLGDQGFSYTDILKRYYGQNILIQTAEKVSGVPQSYPGYPLKKGSTGKDVRTIQEQLNVISNNYPAIRKVAADGIFGTQTDEAVSTFQGIFRLAVDGIVGFSTWYKISEIYTAVARLASLG